MRLAVCICFSLIGFNLHIFLRLFVTPSPSYRYFPPFHPHNLANDCGANFLSALVVRTNAHCL